MKSRFMKAALMAVAAISTIAAMSATAFASVTLTHPSSTQVQATTTNSVDRLVLAEFDLYGRLQYLTVGAQGSKTVTNTFTMDQEYQTKIMQFSNFSTATALEDVRLLGSKTLGVWQGSDGVVDMAVGSLDPYGAFSAGASTGNIAVDTDITCTNSGSSTLNETINWFHIPYGAATTDWAVIQFDLTVHSTSSAMFDNGLQAYLYDGNTSDNGYQDIVTIKPSGLSSTAKIAIAGGSSSSISTNTVYRIAVALNREDRIVNVYNNGSLSKTIDLSSSSYDLSAIRFHLKGEYYNFSLDNILVYEGIAPRDGVSTEILRKIAINESVSMYNESYPGRYDDENYTSQLNGKKAVHATTGVVYTGSDKVILTNLPYQTEDGTWMVPKDELASVLGISCGSTSGSATKNGVTYVPIDSFLSGQTYDHGIGASHNDNLYVLGTTSFSADDADDMNDYMLYYRPSKDEVLEAYNNSDLKGEHPRLMATQEDFDNLRAIAQKYCITSDGAFNGSSTHYDASKIYYANDAPVFWIRRGLQYAASRIGDVDHGTPEFVPTNASQSSRMAYQRYLASDLHAFGWAWQLTGDSKYAEAAWEDLEVVCGWSELNLSHKLDVSEAMAALAIGYDWLYDYWVAYDAANGTDRLGTLEKALYDLGLYVSWQGYSSVGAGMGTEFIMTNNHGTVANSAATMLALAMMDVYPEECAWIVSQAMKGMEITIYKWNTEMWYEGASYWELTMQHTVKFLDALDGVLGTDYGFSNLEGLSNAAKAEMMFHAPRGIYNFGDAYRSMFYVPELVWLANRYDDQEIARELGIDITYKTTINDLQWQGEDYALISLWYDPEAAWAAGEITDLDYVNEDLDVITSRNSWDWENYAFFGAKGGNDPTDGHAHLDTGSFVYEVNGVRWANDLGNGTYDNDYFSETARWLHMTVRAEAHNTIHDNQNTSGVDQKRAYADLKLVDSDSTGVIATVNMTPALSNASSATRGFFFTDNRQSLVIRDEINVNNTNKIWWNMMLPYGTTITDNGDGYSYTLTYTVGETEQGLADSDGYVASHTETLRLEYNVTNGTIGDAVLEGSSWAPIDSTNMLDVGVTKSGQIRFSVTPTSASNDVYITIKLTPGDSSGNVISGATAITDYMNGISSWSL